MGKTLMNELQEYRDNLDTSIMSLAKLGRQKARAEANYRTALAQMILILRAQGTAVTIINDLARGDENIAELKVQRDIAEVLYDACIEAINSYKLNMRIIEAQISREWGRVEYD